MTGYMIHINFAVTLVIDLLPAKGKLILFAFGEGSRFVGVIPVAGINPGRDFILVIWSNKVCYAGSDNSSVRSMLEVEKTIFHNKIQQTSYWIKIVHKIDQKAKFSRLTNKITLPRLRINRLFPIRR